MRSSALDKGLRTGVVFGIIIVTMFLIGFTVTGAERFKGGKSIDGETA